MKFLFDTVRMALFSLWAKKARSFLSILGIVIGILTISGLLTIALGVRREITKSIEGLGSNLVAVVPGKVSSSGSPNFFAQLGASTLTENDFNLVGRQAPEAQNLTMAMLLAGTVKNTERTLGSSIIFAATPNVPKTFNLTLKEGRFLEEADETGRARLVVLGAGAARGLFGDLPSVGKTLELRGETFTVVGVLGEVKTASSFGGPDINSMVIMPLRTGWEISGTKQIFRILMQAPNSDAVGPLKEKIRQLILENHRGEEDFTVLSQDDILGIVGNILNVLTAMLSAIAAISLIVGGIGIMNIMLVAVSERTREIGIRKAVGATSDDILLQFLAEAVILTLLGGMVAVLIFVGLVKIAAPRFPIPLEASPLIIFLSLEFSALVGIIFGLVPAFQASRKSPIEALRYE